MKVDGVDDTGKTGNTDGAGVEYEEVDRITDDGVVAKFNRVTGVEALE